MSDGDIIVTLTEQLAQMTSERDELQARLQTDFNLREMLSVISLADSLGWNGVDNSKVLSTFLKSHINALESELQAVKQERDELKILLERIEGIIPYQHCSTCNLVATIVQEGLHHD